MGYTTEFKGSLNLSRNLTEDEKNYITLFCDTRRMKRDVNKLMELYDGKHGYPFATENTPESIYGFEGEYFAMNDGESGQRHDDSIIDYNNPPGKIGYCDNMDFNTRWKENQKRLVEGLCTPGLWCQWIITRQNDSDILEWDGGEKFYDYVEWIKYLISHFFSKWGVLLNGEIEWVGEESSDIGKFVVTDNVTEIYAGVISYRKT